MTDDVKLCVSSVCGEEVRRGPNAAAAAQEEEASCRRLRRTTERRRETQMSY